MKQLEHFLLPEQTNRLYEQEAISSISLTRDVAKKINELVDAYNELNAWQLAKHQEQDGEIRKGILYMKDNLVNTLDDMMKLLVENGFIEERIGVLKEVVDTFDSRMSNLMGQIKAGTSSMDAEIIDGRTGIDGILYSCIGDAIRNQLKKSLIYQGSLNTSDNIDELFNVGVYYANRPSGTVPVENSVFMLEVVGTGKIVVQTLTQFGTGKMYKRTHVSAWSKWVLQGDDFSTYKRNATSEDTLEDLKEEGEYWIDKTATGGIYPYTSRYYLLEVTGLNTNFIIQKLTSFSNSQPKVFTRSFYNTWSEWAELTKSTQAVEINSVWRGKTMNVLGDSIAYGSMGNFADVIRDTLGLSKVNNYAVGGARISSTEYDNQYFPVYRQYENMDDADIILVHGGTNDYSTQVPLGESDSNDVTTFNGALNVLMTGLREKYPDKLIIFSNILHRFNDTRLPIICDEYRKAMEERCLANHIVFYDSYKYTGFDFAKGYYDHVLTSDGLHPNEKGAGILGRKLAGFINWQ